MPRRWAALAVGMVACIIPDNQIDVQPPRTNPGAVRIVELAALPEAANEACARSPGFTTCPLPPLTLPSGLIREEGQTFCVCPDGTVDNDALFTIDIYVEDPDVDRQQRPSDDIFGAFLLDVPPDATDVDQYVAYTNYLDPDDPAQLVPLGDFSYSTPIERPPTNLKAWSLGVDERVDLCNNDDGSRLDPEQRLHTLRLVVTDRPWYVPVAQDEKGAPERDDGVLVREGDPLVGVPDLPGGATYAVANYVFECQSDEAGAESPVCDCVDPTLEEG